MIRYSTTFELKTVNRSTEYFFAADLCELTSHAEARELSVDQWIINDSHGINQSIIDH